jgi:hypothetical protein
MHDRKGYYLYRKIIRKSTWALEESFNSLTGIKNKTSLWLSYIKDIQLHYMELNNNQAFMSKLEFLPDFLDNIHYMANLFLRYKAILPINEYFRLLWG